VDKLPVVEHAVESRLVAAFEVDVVLAVVARAVTGFAEPEGKRGREVGPAQRRALLAPERETVAAHRKAGENRGPADHANRGGDEGVPEADARFGQRVQFGRLEERLARHGQLVVPLVVGEEEDEVRARNRRIPGPGFVRRRAEECQKEDNAGESAAANPKPGKWSFFARCLAWSGATIEFIRSILRGCNPFVTRLLRNGFPLLDPITIVFRRGVPRGGTSTRAPCGSRCRWDRCSRDRRRRGSRRCVPIRPCRPRTRRASRRGGVSPDRWRPTRDP